MNLEEYERMYRFEDTYWWFISRRRLISTLIRDTYESPVDILDVGCGTGAMLDDLKEFGSVVGADFSPEALSFCRRRGERTGHDYQLVRADIRALPFADNSFDVVTAMDIIEHIDHDTLASSEIARVLKPGGRLFATVPAYNSLWSEHDVALHHHRRYAARQFRDVLQRGGLEIERLSYAVCALMPFVWIFRQFTGLIRKGKAAQTHLPEFPQAVNSFLI